MTTPNEHPRRARRPIAGPAGVLLVLLGATASAAGCTPEVAQATGTTTVLVARFEGYHSSLLLPVDDGWVEYAYGSWNVWANNDPGYFGIHALAAVTVLESGTLAHRVVRTTATDPGDVCAALRSGAYPCESVLAIEVDAGAARRLLRELDRTFLAAGHTRVRNEESGLDFVLHAEDDNLFWANCNHMVERWIFLADFELV